MVNPVSFALGHIQSRLRLASALHRTSHWLLCTGQSYAHVGATKWSRRVLIVLRAWSDS